MAKVVFYPFFDKFGVFEEKTKPGGRLIGPEPPFWPHSHKNPTFLMVASIILNGSPLSGQIRR